MYAVMCCESSVWEGCLSNCPMEIMDIVRKSNSKQFVELNAKLKMIELLEEKGQNLYDLEELQYFSGTEPPV